jgi:hypothetical protein
MYLVRGLSFLIAALLLLATPVKAQVYRNEEFGITVPFPKETLPCLAPEDQHDHGPVFLLGTSDPGTCGDVPRIEQSRHVDIFAFFNALDDTKKLHDLLKWACGGVGKESCGQGPPDLGVSGLRSAAGRVNHPDGWIDIIVVTQAGKPDLRFDDAFVPSVNYILTLHTTGRHFEEDLRTFRAVLATIRFSPADPPRR